MRKPLLLLLLFVCIISGQGGELVERGDTTYGGKWVVNPSGGLISKGHPLGATGKGRKKPINALKSVLALKQTPHDLSSESASWAIDSEAMRVRGIIVS